MFRQFALALLCALPLHAGQFTVAAWNLELYLDAPSGSMPVKPEPARAKIREVLKSMNADVLALQEMGDAATFATFQRSLREAGLDYPHSEFVRSRDTTLHLAVLSRYPIVARRSHTNESFLLNGRRMHVLRGFAHVDIRVDENYQFTLLTAHLKSKRQTGLSDEADVREQEALLLREKIDAVLAARPSANLILLGDLNDFRDSRPIRTIIGRGKNSLIDTRPAERNGDTHSILNEPGAKRQITWTHFYAKEDTYSRLDYILLSRGMAHEWQSVDTYIVTTPNWGIASDHRPILATFTAVD